MGGLILLVLGVAVLLLGVMLARSLVALGCGVHGFRAVIGINAEPWREKSFGARAALTGAGVVGYYLAVVLVTAAGFLLSGRTVIDVTSMRVNPSPEGPAARAGVRSGDRVVAVNDSPIHDWDALKSEVAKHPGEEITVTIDRDGKVSDLRVTPGGDGSAKGKILVGPIYEQRDVGVGRALAEGFATPPRVWGAALRGVIRGLRGGEKEEVTGAVGLVRETNAVAKRGLGDSLKFLGALASYLFYIVLIVSLAFFPRARASVKTHP